MASPTPGLALYGGWTQASEGNADLDARFAARGISVKDAPYNAKGDGMTDDTTAFIAAIVDAALVRGTVFVPAGTYKITSSLTISTHRTRIQGMGKQASIINFVPKTTASCFRFSTGIDAELVQCSIRGIGFSSTDTTSKKTAIELVDTTELRIDDVAIYPWTGSNSIGLWLRGRELTHASDISIHADQPIKISPNPNSSISCDHLHVQDAYLIPLSTNPCILVDDGVNVTSMTWDGQQAWVGGTYGIYWKNTVSPIASQYLRFANVRREQAALAAGQAFFIASSKGQIQSVVIDDVGLDVAQNGIYLRGVLYASLRNVNYPSSSMEALNVDSTVHELAVHNCQWQTGATASTGGMTEVWGIRSKSGPRPLPSTGSFQSNAGNQWVGAHRLGGTRTYSYSGSVPDGGTLDLIAIADANGRTAAVVTVAAYSAAGPIREGGVVISTPGSAIKIAGTPNFLDSKLAGKICFVGSGPTPQIYNGTDHAVNVVVTIAWI
jgi:hypothetical protein